ncbi:hypothetical protein [Streptomyces candidus]|uniref:DUF2637 domain-containing protein n=1 Tax=Streptomyces candidus TaxID=67283 RepID=A0A7X0HP97_9ACTN|nr:hypothetical protein [Streptomyces candidus]MBB6440104.1 hypothetical protein [Streptomyces candidus]GHH58035.1 hypothetical protein GCM10018773_66020 [Streptomyces candidus]
MSIPKMSVPACIKSRRLNVFAAVEVLLTLAALALVAITVGGKLGPMLGLHGKLAVVVGWSIALVYDALWIGALRMSEVAIRQRSKVGVIVMLGLTVVAVGVSTATLLVLGHAQVFAGVPVAAALFMGLRLFAANVLADGETATAIADQSAEDRNARALAAADARHLRSGARTDVVLETAGHLAEIDRQIARAEFLTAGQGDLLKARAKAEKKLAEADEEYGEEAVAFASRPLALSVTRPQIPAPAVTAVTQVSGTSVTPSHPASHPAVTADETDSEEEVERVPVEDPMTLEELAEVANVHVPQKGVKLSDEQIEVVLRWLRYDMDPPRSYRQAVEDYRKHGFVGGESRIRPIWALIEAREKQTA